MKRLLLSLLLCLASASFLSAEVARPAPGVTWLDANGRTQSLAAFKGQSVILIIAPSPKSWAFRSQVGQLQKMYQRIAADRVVCLVAFTEEPGLIKSNIPFAIVADGPRAAYEYQTSAKFGIALIGRDGNLDYVTNHVLPVQRIYDIIGDSFVPQQQIRR